MELVVFTLFGKKIFMNIAKNKNIFINLENIKLLIFYSCSFLLIPSFTFAAGSGMHSPIEQFVVKTLVDIKDPIFGYDISFTNASLFMILASIVPLAILIMGVRAAEMVPGKIQSISEMMFEFVENLLIENTGDSGRPYFSFIFTLFLLVLFGNLLGMLPYSYTFTSQIIITFFMARGEDYSMLAGFDAGADDYITKPIKPKVLVSKVNALLRRIVEDSTNDNVVKILKKCTVSRKF